MLVLDEPNSNLDDAGEYALMMALKALKDKGTTIIFITHKKNLLTLADKLIVIKDGIVMQYDERNKVLASLAQHKAVK